MHDLSDTFIDRRFRFWIPSQGRVVLSGAERYPVPVPHCPHPVSAERWDGTGEPTDVAIGEGIYDYLRQYPDCEHNEEYAELLREAYPHYLTDLAAQIIMIDAKTVDAPYIQRKINGLKILTLLEPDNAGLWQHLGTASIDLGLMFAELPHCRRHLLAGRGFLQRSLALKPVNPAALSLLAQLDYWCGDYRGAVQCWSEALTMLPEGNSRSTIAERIDAVERGAVPVHPLLDDLEAVGQTLTMIAAGRERDALTTLERLEEEGVLLQELPMPEFYHLLGLCRERCGNADGAFAAYEQALTLDPELIVAMEGRERVQVGSSS